MRRLSRHLISFAIATVLVSPSVMITGCAARVSTGYRVYDPSYGDYHVWDDNEAGFYGRWEVETHRTHSDFRKRPVAEQNEYFTWRHAQH